jgi:SAM-dependent methyltransferase
VRRVLCVAAAGGQQAPLFAALGCEVTSVDLSPEQLSLDRQVAEQHGLAIECVEADMLDLSAMHGRDFDLVYQAVSACYVPDARCLYAEIARVLRPGGYYRVEHWNPVYMQLSERETWNGHAYQLVHPQVGRQPVPWQRWDADGPTCGPTCWHFVHPLGDLIGGLCDAGFAIVRFAERGKRNAAAKGGSEEHLAAFVPPFFSMMARRLMLPRPPQERRP